MVILPLLPLALSTARALYTGLWLCRIKGYAHQTAYIYDVTKKEIPTV
jgi:hypothetical protein